MMNNHISIPVVVVMAVACLAAVSTEKALENEVAGKSIRSGEDLVAAVSEDCVNGNEAMMTCLRRKVFAFVSNLLGVPDEFEGRGLSDDAMDDIIARRLGKYVSTHDFRFNLPDFLFDGAQVTVRPRRGLDDFDVDFPEESANAERSLSEARGILKKKLIFPLLLLLKLKIKALTPILLVLIGIKAVKAFIMSKISFLLVVGFMLLQLFKKGGMNMAMAMPMPMAMPTPTEPAPVYGPVPTPSYGPPAPTPDTSYGPWEPSNGNGNGGAPNGNGNGSPYSRWDANAMAYSAYQPDQANVKTAQQLQQGL